MYTVHRYIKYIPYNMSFDGTRACFPKSYRLTEVNPTTLPFHHRLKTNSRAVLRCFKKLFGNGRRVKVDEAITAIALGLEIHGKVEKVKPHRDDQTSSGN